jgi:2-polyprenyl-3-methyl-5-hydroxy-6-metoxy-1,4-benzoquinol methylase
VIPETVARTAPDEATQQRFWNEWNSKHRNAERVAHLDIATIRRRDTIMAWLRELDLPEPHILDLGCATGWLTAQLTEFGPTTGIDIADASIREARTRYPQLPFECGDFAKLESNEGRFDVVVSLDTLSHVADQPAFVRQVRRVLKPGGYLMLTIQNRFVFERRSDVDPQGVGQIRRWLTRTELREILADDFVVRRLTTLVPEGHLGILRFVNSYRFNGLLRTLGLRAAIDRGRERLGLGQTIAVLAQRR